MASSSPAMLHSSVCSSFVAPLSKPSVLVAPVSASPASPSLSLAISAASSSSPASSDSPATLGRRSIASLSGVAGMLFLLSATPQARADIEDDYKVETQKVIGQVRSTLGLDKADPTRGDAVKSLRQTSNEWVAKYRREKRFAGKPSYSNIYSVLNAVSGHFISYGDGAPLPAKRRTQILEEVDIAERALGRGR
ncbi:hypothetical protein L7F22_026347 [Adiantum nelumboides]|nr:hypothetical protein [Adiantum nelumboides]